MYRLRSSVRTTKEDKAYPIPLIFRTIRIIEFAAAASTTVHFFGIQDLRIGPDLAQ